MNDKTKKVILIVAFVQIILAAGLLALPRIALAIPGRYRVALEERSPFLGGITEGLIDQVAPSADILPTPIGLGDRADIVIPSLVETASPSPAPTQTSTSQPMADPVDTVNSDGERTPAQTSDATPTPPSPTPTQVPTPEPTPTLAPLPGQVLLDSMPRIQQSFNNCGPANLTQVLNWYGNETTQTQAASYLKPNPEDRNVSPWQLSDYVNDFTDLRATVHSGGDLEMIKRFLASGMPVIVEKGYEPGTESSPGWFGHYLTVFGYDEDQQTFTVMDSFLRVDPIKGRSDPYNVIESFWQHFNYTFYVVYEPHQEETVRQILGPNMLDPLLMWQKAAVKAQSDIESDPQNAFAWFNLGTSLTRLGELTGEAEYYQNGAAAFDEARQIGLPPRMLWYQFRPYIAYMKVGRYDDMVALADTVLIEQGGRNVEETYLYLGHALLLKGNGPDAAAAYERALELNSNFYPAEIALQSLG